MLAINDIHIGFDRKAGTTPGLREELRTYLLDSLDNLLTDSEEKHLLVVGDLFDKFEVDPRDWFSAFTVLTAWLNRGKSLTLVAGNHDHSPKAQRVSSFQVLCSVLQQGWPGRAQVIGIDDFAHVMGHDNDIALAHCSNQDVFNIRMEEVLQMCRPGTRVFVHANFDNSFAVESDHSLNVSRDVAKRFVNAGATLIFAHVHQARTSFGGSVVLLGNQWPTSVSDCLGNDEKFAHVITGGIKKVMTWSRDGDNGFAEVDWRELLGCTAAFIRVVGTATSNEASEAISTIAKFRQKSDAFLITNAVKVEGIAEVNALPESFEAAKAFDVMEFISQHLDGDEMRVVKELAQ